MKNQKITIIIYLFFSLLMACKPDIELDDENKTTSLKKETEVYKEKQLEGLIIGLQFVSPQTLAKREIGSQKVSKVKFDSLVNYYGQSLTFQLSYRINKDKIKENGDLMFADVSNIEEYKQRFMEMNFNMEEKLVMKVTGLTTHPKLVAFENGYGLDEEKKLSIVFVPESKEEVQKFKNSPELEIEYNDEIFKTGTHHFLFKTSELN